MRPLLHIKAFPRVALMVSLLCFSAARAQISIAKLEEQFTAYNKKVLQEKVFMHVDRTFYVAGDILWCKLYVVDGTFHQPLDMSKVAYIEIYGPNHTPVLQAKIALESGKGNGSIPIPVTIESGNYKIRAYTNWMKNAGADYFFEKDITIVNTQKGREIMPKNASFPEAVPDIRMFPEGGNLVAGIAARVACKVQGNNGKGIAFRGAVIDEKNDTIVRFNSLKFGMGSFYFTPAPEHTYKAVFDLNGQKYTKDLPEIFKQGYVMRLTPDKMNVQVSVQTNLTDVSELYLLVHTRQALKATLRGRLENGMAIFSIERSRLGDGISSFTVLTVAGKPVCERLYFTNPRQQLNINMSTDKTTYDTRSRIDLTAQTSDETGKPVSTDMSVAIYRVDDLQGVDQNNIQSFLWLSSDLRGDIESPGYYFTAETNETVAAMDNLMLTQGWRRFRWDDILQEKTPLMNFVPEINGHIVTGKVISTVTGKPVDNIETYISVPGLNSNMLVYISDADGKIKYDFKRMKGTSEIVVQTNSSTDTMVRVEINNPFFESYSSTSFAQFRLLKKNEKNILDQSISVNVQNMYAGTKLRRFSKFTDTVSLFEKPDAVYFLDNYVRFSSTEEVLREYVGFMDVLRRKEKYTINLIDNYSIPILGVTNSKYFEANPLILVDGVPIFTNERLLTYDPIKMRKLEVFNRRYFLGNSFFSGILNWTTYKGDLANFELDPRSLVIDYEGMQLQREFYSPVYDTPESVSSRLPDYRTLLYWSPSIIADPKGKGHISFYSSDKKGDYIAVIQGLGINGSCGSNVLQFEVK